MRTIVTNYTFLPSTNQVVFNGYTSIMLENVLLVLDATQNVVLYNPTVTGCGGTVAGNVLTLAQSASALGCVSTDKIQIFYEDNSVPIANYFSGMLERMVKKLGLLSFSASASGASLNANITNTPAVSISGTPNFTAAASTNGIGGVTLGTTVTQAGQSQQQMQLVAQSTFRRNLPPI